MAAFFHPDGSPFDPDLVGLEAGSSSDPIELELWHERGNPDGQRLEEILVFAETWDSVDLVWRRDALPPQVEGWLELRCVGQVAASHPEQLPYTSDWISIGYGQAIGLPPIYADCGRRLELRFRVPSTAAEGAWRWRLVALSAEHSSPLPGAELGIVSGYGTARTSLLRGGEVLATDPPSADVEVSARLCLFAGWPGGFAASTITLDQVDGAAEDLEPGEAYLAAIAQGLADLVVVKGARAVLPQYPATPAGHIVLRWLQVSYSDPETIVEELDLLEAAPLDRFAVRSDVGLSVIVGSGIAQGGGTRRWWMGSSTVPVPDDAVVTIWQLPTGRYDAAATALVEGSLALAEVTTAAGEVAAIRDLRSFAGRWQRIQLGGVVAAPPLELGRWVCSVPRAVIDRVWLVVDVAGGGTGETQVDLEVDGVSIFGGGIGVPAIAGDAVDLVVEGGVPNGQLVLTFGDVLVARLLELPAGGSPEQVHLLVAMAEV